MPNTYNSGTKIFEINAANIDWAGLTTLKGSAPDLADMIYCSEGYKATIDAAANVALKFIYINDNSGGTASVKTGYCDIIMPGYTLTLHDTTVGGGLTGKTGAGVGYYSILGTAGSLTTVKANTIQKLGLNNVLTLPHIFQNCVIDQFANIISGNTASQMINVTMKNVASGGGCFYVDANPAAFYGNTVQDAGATTVGRVIIRFNATSAQLNRILANIKIVRAAASANTIAWSLAERQGTDYVRIIRGPAPIISRERHLGGTL